MYGDDVRAFADALYLDHGHTYEDIAFLLADSRKFATQTHQRVMPAASAGDGTSNGPAAAGALASGYVLPCRQRGTSCGCPSTAPVACVDKALCVGRAGLSSHCGWPINVERLYAFFGAKFRRHPMARPLVASRHVLRSRPNGEFLG